ncbi:ABC transporter permease [Cohnella sp.]|uniref:ABC transporter permease n=1 Tax=Cohnella sp. TaxID=1883426 RepID=UPI0035678401
MDSPIVSKEQRIKKKTLSQKLLAQWDIQLMIIPGVILVFIFSYLPMYGSLTAFQEYNLFKGFWASPWVGTKHFEMFVGSPQFREIMRNTISISLLKLIIIFPAPIILALMLNEIRHMLFKRFIQTISYLPHFLSWVIVAGFVGSMLSIDSGSLNLFLLSTNMIREPVNWLSIPEYFWAILISSNLWKEIGFASIVYLAAIAGIDPHLYEAAGMDGASRFKQLYLITLPSILPVVIIFLILAVGNTLNAGFDDLLLLARNPILLDVAEVIDTHVYRVGILSSRYSYATAVGLFKGIISIVLLTAANAIARRSGNSLW